jgi:ribonuclease III
METTKKYPRIIDTGYIKSGDDGEEEIIPIPYNINNKFIQLSDIINILKKMDVVVDKINNINVIQQSFVHKSYIQRNIIPENFLIQAKKELGNPVNLIELQPKSYERLEYLGDRIIKLCVTKYLFLRYPNDDEGFMTKLQTKIEDKRNLAAMSKHLGLDKFFIISRQIEIKYGRNLEKIHEDVFEAFMGALYFSNGFEPCLLFIINLLETLIDYAGKLYCDNNYKDALLRYYHKQNFSYPKYKVIYYEGPPHDRIYLTGVLKNDASDEDSIEDKFVGYGIGNSKKITEQRAAKMSLISFGLLNDDQYCNNDIYYPDWRNIKIKLKEKDNSNLDLSQITKNNSILIVNSKIVSDDSDIEGDELEIG